VQGGGPFHDPFIVTPSGARIPYQAVCGYDANTGLLTTLDINAGGLAVATGLESFLTTMNINLSMINNNIVTYVNAVANNTYATQTILSNCLTKLNSIDSSLSAIAISDAAIAIATASTSTGVGAAAASLVSVTTSTALTAARLTVGETLSNELNQISTNTGVLNLVNQMVINTDLGRVGASRALATVQVATNDIDAAQMPPLAYREVASIPTQGYGSGTQFRSAVATADHVWDHNAQGGIRRSNNTNMLFADPGNTNSLLCHDTVTIVDVGANSVAAVSFGHLEVHVNPLTKVDVKASAAERKVAVHEVSTKFCDLLEGLGDEKSRTDFIAKGHKEVADPEFFKDFALKAFEAGSSTGNYLTWAKDARKDLMDGKEMAVILQRRFSDGALLSLSQLSAELLLYPPFGYDMCRMYRVYLWRMWLKHTAVPDEWVHVGKRSESV